MFDRGTPKLSTLALASFTTLGLSGCGVVTALMGIEVETAYSPEQQEVYFSTLDTAMKARTNGETGLMPEERKPYLEFGKAICAKLESGDKEQVMALISEAAGEAVPGASESSKQQLAQMFILAATAQGSLCQEYR